ncbi:MAG: hypothetical protein PHX24_15110, partial [Acidithiobacillus sp.]|nr:hypothetical protein [Acidithiobacillus sp.]
MAFTGPLTRLTNTRVESRIGDDLFSGMKARERAQESQQHSCGNLADAGNTQQERLLGFQVRVIIHMILDLSADDVNLLMDGKQKG